MAKKKIIGTCHLCGVFGELSDEHVPPKKAYNSGTVIVLDDIEAAIALPPGVLPTKGRIKQGGASAYTLCVRCNNDTGAWYGGEFVRFAKRAYEVIRASRGAPLLLHPIRCRPLRVIKEIAAMFFSVNVDTFHERNAELQQFVLNKRRAGLSPGYRFFAYLTVTPRPRHWGVAAKIDTSGWDPSTGPRRVSGPKMFSEIAFPPLGYVLTFGDDAPDPRLLEITRFAFYGFDQTVDFHLRLPLLETHSALPGEYASLAELKRRQAKAALAHRKAAR